MNVSSGLNRRSFVQTLGFSAAALLTQGWRSPVIGGPSTENQHLFLFGDWGAVNPEPQQQVADAMTRYAEKNAIQPAALLLLGDNFYGQFDGGVDCPRWQSQFESMYPAANFPGPCYALLGNHDYIVEPAGKMEAQLAYAAAHPGTRWKMPAKWYRFDFPQAEPLVTFLMLDSNYQKATPEKLSLSEQERTDQTQWLASELAKPRTAPYVIACGHHPLYSNAGDGKKLIQEWDELFRRYSVHAYFCGHIHDLEHLEFSGHPTSFVVTGGGGTTLHTGQEEKSSARNHFRQGVHGFTHLEINRDRLILRHLGGDGLPLYAFSKGVHGDVQSL